MATHIENAGSSSEHKLKISFPDANATVMESV